MTYFIICILIILCYSSSAFQVIPAKSFAAHNRPYSSLQRQHLSTTEMNSAMATPIKNADNRTREEKWLDYVQSEDVMEIRQQLIDKYLSLGRTQEYAELEIDTFLNDQSRSRKYLEMRKNVEAQKEASLGFENFLLYGGAFFVGLLGDAFFKHIM